MSAGGLGLGDLDPRGLGTGRYLSDWVVLDLGQLHPGPYAAMLLAQLGATVIKVEKPGGDTARQLGRDTFAKYNRGKQSIVLDLKKDDDRDILLRLVRASDVLIEGFRPGVMEKLGVGYGRLARENPRLVMCSITGFGQTGPYAHRPGHDINYLALAGYWAVPAQVQDVVARPRLRLSDYCAAMHAALAIMAAVTDARASGTGQHLDVSIHDAMTAWMAPGIEAVSRRGGPDAANLDHVMPDNDLFETADGRYIALGILEDKFWANLVAALGTDFPDLQADAHTRRAGRLSAKSALNRRLREVFATRTRAQWERLFEGHDLPWAPVLEHDEVSSDRHIRHRGGMRSDQDGHIAEFPVKFSKPVPNRDAAAPTLDADRDAILNALDAKIAETTNARLNGDRHDGTAYRDQHRDCFD